MLAEAAGPAALDRALDRVQDGFILQLFNKTATLERWHENRHASFERYVAFLVLFHQMTVRVASFAPLAFNISRSQSQLRVATTAAPISAAEIQQQWGVDFHDFGENPLESITSADRDETLTRIDNNHGNVYSSERSELKLLLAKVPCQGTVLATRSHNCIDDIQCLGLQAES